MRVWRWLVVVPALLLTSVSAARAETVGEGWRSASSTFLGPYAVSVNAADGSCWVADIQDSAVVHLSAAGVELWRSPSGAFDYPYAVSANPADNSCWVADPNRSQIVHLGADGAELWRSPSGAFSSPYAVSANPADNSCWVADQGHSQVVHVGADGTELWRSPAGAFLYPDSVAVNAADNTCWVADTSNSQVVHLAANGAELWRSTSGVFSHPYGVAVNTADNSCWVADTNHSQVVHLAEDGSELCRASAGAFSYPYALSADPSDGSCWVADSSHSQIVHLSAAGAELWRSVAGAYDSPSSVSVNPNDKSCWVADGLHSQVVHVSTDGLELWRSITDAFYQPYALSVNRNDGSCWVADTNHAQVAHVGSEGTELWRSPGGAFFGPYGISVNTADNSCWVADTNGSRVVHLAENGSELWRSPDDLFDQPYAVSANPTDNSCWVANTMQSQIVHLAADGQVLWSSGEAQFYYPCSVSVNPTDNSCWVADTNHSQVVHLGADGTELWRSEEGRFAYPYSVSVNPTDGSCWVADTSDFQIVHLAADGTELWRSDAGQFRYPRSVSVNVQDGSCWVADTSHYQVVHLSAQGEELWWSANGEFDGPAAVSVNATDGACWVADFGGMETEGYGREEGASRAGETPSGSAGRRLYSVGVVVKLIPSPKADFSGAPVTGLAPLSVCFEDESTDGPTAWSWAFGDGGTSTERSPTHSYAALGVYDVSLTVTNLAGEDTAIKLDYITVGPPAPVADFSAESTSGPAPLLVQFADQSIGVRTAWLWTFGDGGTATAQNPIHSYADPGSYDVSLTACNITGSTTATKAHYITVFGPGPVAGFAGAPTSGPAPLTVAFSDTSTGSPTAWSWTFGDSGTSTVRHPNHQYTAIGRYDVSLMVTNASGSNTLVKPDYITVAPAAPTADFSAAATSGGVPLLVQFGDQSTGSPTAWAWTFGDGGTSTQQNPAHTYAAAGTYTVSLVATNLGGAQTRTRTNYIIAYGAPTADFTATPLAGYAPMLVDFTCATPHTPSHTAALAWEWDFGDKTSSTVENPAHTYRKPGYRTVNLTASNPGGSNTATKQYYVMVSFPDVPIQPAFWALQEILSCADGGIVTGYPDGNYLPRADLNRDQMAAFISRALVGGDANLPSPPTTPTFADVPTTHWAYQYVEYCAAQHVVTGYKDGTYRPEQPVDRAQMSVYVARAIASPSGEGGLVSYTPPTTPSFSDVAKTHWSYKYTEYCKAQGVIHGYPDALYHPEWIVSRDQMAVYVTRAFDLPL